MLFVLDNYDSFTYNLVQRFGEIDAGIDMQIVRNNEITVAEVAALSPQAIVVSPGPCSPTEAGISMALIRELGPTIPTLGVCLGHQSIAQVFDSQVIRASRLMHGKLSPVHHTNQGLFAGLPQPMTCTRYHSLIVPEATLSADLEVTAWADYPGHPREVMGLAHKRYPIHGVQFHPESFLTESGTDLLRNFLMLAGILPARTPAATV
ncbi:MAG: anthranilate/aminodeoxychorismate synthase component II [Planctomyces sp.]|jgi:anthranilate synthase component 2|nr:anthranilate/aminodeoxychorismate synthase component II [Planctomyces sp.]